MEKSYAAQKSLLQANQASEMESSEIRDFLQAEKAMLSDTIKELEKEVCCLFVIVYYCEQVLINYIINENM